MTWIFLYFFFKLEYFWIFDVYSYVGEQVFEDYENGTFSIDGLLEVIFLKQLFTQIVFVCLFFSKGAVTVKFWKSRFSTRASNIRYDRGVFLQGGSCLLGVDAEQGGGIYSGGNCLPCWGKFERRPDSGEMLPPWATTGRRPQELQEPQWERLSPSQVNDFVICPRGD